MQTHRSANGDPKPLVLLVEPDAAVRTRLSKVLSGGSAHVRSVSSGRQAMAALKHERPAVIVANVTLADTSGWELAQRIRDFDRDLPILLLSNGRKAPSDGSPRPQVQALLRTDLPAPVFLKEVERWLARPEPDRSERWPITILVVDDEPKIRIVLEHFLRLRGFTVATAASGEEALRQYARYHPTVVFLDVKMPGIGGLATLKQLKHQQPDLTVICITGAEDQATMEEALTSGASDYILKPFNLDYLETSLLSKILTGGTP